MCEGRALSLPIFRPIHPPLTPIIAPSFPFFSLFLSPFLMCGFLPLGAVPSDYPFDNYRAVEPGRSSAVQIFTPSSLCLRVKIFADGRARSPPRGGCIGEGKEEIVSSMFAFAAFVLRFSSALFLLLPPSLRLFSRYSRKRSLNAGSETVKCRSLPRVAVVDKPSCIRKAADIELTPGTLTRCDRPRDT